MAIIIDLILIGIIVAVCVNSYMQGLIISVFNLVSSLLAMVIAFFLYPVLAGALNGTALLEWIQSPIRNSLLEAGAGSSHVSAEALIEKMNLPDAISNNILNTVGSASEKLPDLAEHISATVAEFILQVICIIVLFLIAKLCLLLVKRALKTVTKLPLLHQVDKLGGLAFGVVEAFVLLTVVGAIFALFSGSVDSGVLQAVENSFLARFFYEDNWLIALLGNKI